MGVRRTRGVAVVVGCVKAVAGFDGGKFAVENVPLLALAVSLKMGALLPVSCA